MYKVWHRTWHCEMAVKTPRPGAFTTQAQKDTFTRECETWINLGLHAHIAACHYVRELGGAPRVFSEYAERGHAGGVDSLRATLRGPMRRLRWRGCSTRPSSSPWGLHRLRSGRGEGKGGPRRQGR